MLLGPQVEKQARDPEADGFKMVQPGMAAGADGNKQIAVVDAGLTVMDVEPLPCPAGQAEMAITI